MANTTESLDLYAKVEDLLENSEAIDTLYNDYYDILSQLSFNSLLDVGCGSGAYLVGLTEQFPTVSAKGIDLSGVMVSRAQAKGVDAEAIDLCDLDGSFDVITAVFDMLNYLPKEALEGFFSCIRAHLNEGGYFLFDINTLYGFENVAVGAYVIEDETRFLAIDSDFDAGVYEAQFTLFEKEGVCYEKSQETIRQYYHTLKEIEEISGMRLVNAQAIELYGLGDEDKVLVVLQK